MKIGLLLCDHVREEFLHIQGDYSDMFRAWLPHFEMEDIDVCRGIFPEDVDQYDIYLATGSRFSVYDDLEWIYRLKRFIRDIQKAGKTYIGVCFGHQILADALGGKVEKAKIGWSIGVQTFHVHQEKPWMLPPQNPMNLLMMCQDQVMELPSGGELLAGTKTCPVGIFQVGDRMLGIQAHPEFSRTYDQALMEARVEKMGIDTVKAGIKSLELPIHSFEMREWVTQFVQKNLKSVGF